MWKGLGLVAIFLVAFMTGYILCVGSDDMVTEGKWHLIKVEQCENPDDYDLKYDVTRSRVNRTHDCFSADVSFPMDIEENMGIRVDIDKMVDGGEFKRFQELADDSFCNFVKKYGEDNFRTVLEIAGIDPPDCPLPKGDWSIKDFIFNYDELPNKCIEGLYIASAYIVKDKEDIACASITAEFKSNEDDDDGDE